MSKVIFYLMNLLNQLNKQKKSITNSKNKVKAIDQ